MAQRKIPAGFVIVGGFVALYILCKKGALQSFGDKWQICNILKRGIPGTTLAGGGAIVAIGSDTVSLQALLLKLKQLGIGKEQLSAVQKGDQVPAVIYPVGHRFKGRDGLTYEIQGYSLQSANAFNAPPRSLHYYTVTRDGTTWYTHPTYVNPPQKMITVV